MKFKLTSLFFPFGRKLFFNIMKVFIFLCCFTAFSFTPTKLLSQNATISIQSTKTLTVDEVFDLIMSQTNYKFVYEEGIFNDFPKVYVVKGTIKANDLLTTSLSGGNFIFTLSSNNTVLIKKRLFNSSQNQELLTGKVVDSNNLPVPGVSVSINSNERGTTTNFDGIYSVKISVGDKISFSFLGFETQVFVYNNQKQLNVTMKEDIAKLDEVVLVSSGYQKISKERATGAYESLNKDQMDKPASNISERLVGMIAGLQSSVNADGTIDFEIRGQSSLFADQQPLIVLDGFPVEGGFNTINPNDVESVTVLKDAAAASIWGAKSANGVIVVTTKRAKKGKTSVAISSFTRFSNKLDLDYVLARASSAETMEYEQKAFDTNLFGSVFGGPPPNSPNSFGPYSQAFVSMNEARLGRITGAQRDANLARLRGLDNKSQISDLLLQAPITSQYNITISGGNEAMTNNLSLLYEDNKTYFQGDQIKKYLINYNTHAKINKRLDFDFAAMMQYNNSTKNSGIYDPNYGDGDMLSLIKTLAPWDMLVDSNGNPTDMSYLKYYRPNLDAYVPFNDFPYADWSYNPVTEIKNRDLTTEQLNARVQTGLTLEIMKGLTLSSKIQYEMFTTTIENYYSDKTFAVRQFINETSGPEWQTGGKPTQLVPSGSILEQGRNKNTAYNFRNQLNFDRVFAEKHAVNFVGGTELSNRVIETTKNPLALGYNRETLSSSQLLKDINTSSLWDFYPARFASILYDFDVSPIHKFTETTNRFFSVYGNLSYTFDDKYSVSGSYRTDASNIIADDPKFRYNPFWSVGLGWQIGKENFMLGAHWVDRLNLRGTYGSNGNIDRSTSFRPLVSLGTTLDPVTQEDVATISSFGNPTLRWEKTKTLNFGIDFSLLNRKIYGSVDFYDKKGSDLIVDQSISAVNGTRSQKFNNGEIENKGIEVQLGTRMPIKDKLVDFWASWCVPCRKSFPHLKDLYTKYNKEGLEIIGVGTADEEVKWRKAIGEDQTPWKHVYDVGPKRGYGKVSTAYGVPFLPTTFLVDSKGTIILRNPTKDELDKKLTELFGH